MVEEDVAIEPERHSAMSDRRREASKRLRIAYAKANKRDRKRKKKGVG